MPEQEINLTNIMTLILHEAIQKTDCFNKFDINRILVAGSKNKKESKRGTYSKVVPLRFKNGKSVIRYEGHNYCIPKIKVSGTEILYIIYFYMPSFFNLNAEEKIKVLFHELYHISPDFNGDIRRIGSVKYAHGHSGKKFEENYLSHAEKFFSYIKKTRYFDFLTMNFADFNRHFSKIKINRVKKPKPIKLVKN